MAQLYFKYGTMNSGKSIEILKVAHNYEEQGKPVLLMTSSLDTRAGVGTVASRIGMKAEAIAIDDKMSVFDYVNSLSAKPIVVKKRRWLFEQLTVNQSMKVNSYRLVEMKLIFRFAGSIILNQKSRRK